MFRSLIAILICVLLSCSPTQKKYSSTSSPQNEWVSIFNGKNLNGWIMKIKNKKLGDNFANTFRVEDGILSIRYDGYGDDFGDRFGALYYDRELSEYKLRAEYRFVGETAPGAPDWGYRDSGIQYHCQSPASMKFDQSFPVCLEYNLHGGNGIDDRPVGAICAGGMNIQINGKQNESYSTAPDVKRTFHGDQWVSIEIDVRKDKITHYVNGEEILSFSNPEYNPDHDIGKTFIKEGSLEVTSGYVSLQSNSHPIDFRKIELMEY